MKSEHMKSEHMKSEHEGKDVLRLSLKQPLSLIKRNVD